MPEEGFAELDIPFLNELLQPICGQPLTGFWRAVGQIFEFGVQHSATNRRGEAITKGDFHFKFIAADWRVVQHDRIILGSSDWDGKEWFFESEEEVHGAYNAEARRLAREFLEAISEGKFIAESVEVGPFAEVTIRLSEGLVIESFASSGEDRDLWYSSSLRSDTSCLVGPSGRYFGKSGERPV